ncbi:MAG: hypothetical protein AAGA60_21325 [Cyanobacteria bacterium P01_E01_bin.42]
MIRKLALMTVISFLAIFGSSQQPQVATEAIAVENNEIPENSAVIIRGAIVEREFVDKAGRPRGFSELYFRIAGDNYFIKFCESNVSRDELERHLDRLATSNLAGDNEIALEVEIREGLWICYSGGPIPQSRIGRYVIIHRIVASQTGN